MSQSDIEIVAAGYDAVYAAYPASPTLQRIWREKAAGLDYPWDFGHISFVTLAEVTRIAHELRLSSGAMFVDLGCGMGGPGLWVARETGAQLIGVDASAVAVGLATKRAADTGLSDRSSFVCATFAETGLDDQSAVGGMSIDALQYAPDKDAALAEAARVIRPGGRLVFAAFELEPARVQGLPVLGADPVDDYAPCLEGAGFTVDSYAETPQWFARLTAAYGAVLDAREVLIGEMGGPAVAALESELSVTLQIQPYRRRILTVATRR